MHPQHPPRRRARRAAAPALAVGVLLTAAASAGAAPVRVTLGFDDGMGTRNDPVELLRDTGTKATFYVNTGRVDRASANTPEGEAFNREFLSWDQLERIHDEGHEIAGHTRTHRRLPLDPLDPETPAAAAPTGAELEQEVCGDRRILQGRGFPARSFAYPYGRTDPTASAAVRDCGYLSGRTTTVPDLFAESVPPADPYAVRAYTGDGLSAAQMLAYVDGAIANGGGWVQFLFHDVCTADDDLCTDQTASVNPRQLRLLAQGLAARPEVRVRTAGDVVGADAVLPVPTIPATVAGTVSETTATVRNEGGGPLVVTRVRLTGGDGLDVPGETCTAAPVPAGGTCAIRVRFAPQEPGGTTARLRVSGNTDPVETAVRLTATGVAAPGPGPQDPGPQDPGPQDPGPQDPGPQDPDPGVDVEGTPDPPSGGGTPDPVAPPPGTQAPPVTPPAVAHAAADALRTARRQRRVLLRARGRAMDVCARKAVPRARRACRVRVTRRYAVRLRQAQRRIDVALRAAR